MSISLVFIQTPRAFQLKSRSVQLASCLLNIVSRDLLEDQYLWSIQGSEFELELFVNFDSGQRRRVVRKWGSAITCISYVLTFACIFACSRLH